MTPDQTTQLRAVVLILIWVAVATYGDTLFKTAPSLGSLRFAAATGSYLITSFFAFWTFRLQQWGWIIILWNSISLVFSLFLSVFLFGEPFTLRRRLSALFVLAAILLIE